MALRSVAADAGVDGQGAEEPPAGEELCSPAAELHPDDSISVALEKMFPQHPSAASELAARWLSDKFGVMTYADLEFASAWAEAGMAIVAQDADVSDEVKGVLRQLLLKMLGVTEPTPSAGEAAERTETAVPTKTQFEDSALATLQKLYPQGSSTSLGPAASWLYNFVVLEPLGTGSFGVVHKVEESTSKQQYALKEISISRLRDDDHRGQVQQEVDIHKSLSHPHVLRCYESFEGHGVVLILLELAEGGELHKHMQKENVLKEDEAARFFAEVASGLHYLHIRGVVHRDMKPENILLDCSRCAKIADFGCCTMVSSTKDTLVCGSPAYLSPEMVAEVGYDHRVDIWAVGILLYEMLVGHSPFSSALTETETKKRILNYRDGEFGYGGWMNVPVPAQPLLRDLLRKDPSERLPLPEALAHDWVLSMAGHTARLLARGLEDEARKQGRA